MRHTTAMGFIPVICYYESQDTPTAIRALPLYSLSSLYGGGEFSMYVADSTNGDGLTKTLT